MKTLIVYRHAHTLPAEGGQKDHDRTLSERGMEECEKLGAFIEKQGFWPDHVLCSTSARTQETIQRTSAAADKELDIELSNALYLATPGEIFRRINELEKDPESLMVVGHNPGFHQMSLHLARFGTDPDVLQTMASKFPPASFAVFALECDNWESFTPETPSKLVRFIRPKEL